jgi:hypothetical protein
MQSAGESVSVNIAAGLINDQTRNLQSTSINVHDTSTSHIGDMIPSSIDRPFQLGDYNETIQEKSNLKENHPMDRNLPRKEKKYSGYSPTGTSDTSHSKFGQQHTDDFPHHNVPSIQTNDVDHSEHTSRGRFGFEHKYTSTSVSTAITENESGLIVVSDVTSAKEWNNVSFRNNRAMNINSHIPTEISIKPQQAVQGKKSEPPIAGNEQESFGLLPITTTNEIRNDLIQETDHGAKFMSEKADRFHDDQVVDRYPEQNGSTNMHQTIFGGSSDRGIPQYPSYQHSSENANQYSSMNHHLSNGYKPVSDNSMQKQTSFNEYDNLAASDQLNRQREKPVLQPPSYGFEHDQLSVQSRHQPTSPSVATIDNIHNNNNMNFKDTATFGEMSSPDVNYSSRIEQRSIPTTQYPHTHSEEIHEREPVFASSHGSYHSMSNVNGVQQLSSNEQHSTMYGHSSFNLHTTSTIQNQPVHYKEVENGIHPQDQQPISLSYTNSIHQNDSDTNRRSLVQLNQLQPQQQQQYPIISNPDDGFNRYRLSKGTGSVRLMPDKGMGTTR